MPAITVFLFWPLLPSILFFFLQSCRREHNPQKLVWGPPFMQYHYWKFLVNRPFRWRDILVNIISTGKYDYAGSIRGWGLKLWLVARLIGINLQYNFQADRMPMANCLLLPCYTLYFKFFVPTSVTILSKFAKFYCVSVARTQEKK